MPSETTITPEISADLTSANRSVSPGPCESGIMPEELSIYRENAELLMQMKSDRFISNGAAAHAGILTACFFRNAKHSVRIFCRNLLPQGYDLPEVIAALKSAVLRSDLAVQIIVQEDVPEESQFLREVKELQGKHANLSLELDANARSRLDLSKSPNFAIMDGRAVRFEPDPEKPRATASMNQPAVAKRLNQAFELILGSLRPHSDTPPEALIQKES